MSSIESHLTLVPPEGLAPITRLSHAITQFNRGPGTVSQDDMTARYKMLRFGAERYHVASLGIYTDGRFQKGAMYVGRGVDHITIARFTTRDNTLGVSLLRARSPKDINTLTNYDYQTEFENLGDYPIPAVIQTASVLEPDQVTQKEMIEHLTQAVALIGEPRRNLFPKMKATTHVSDIIGIARNMPRQPAILIR